MTKFYKIKCIVNRIAMLTAFFLKETDPKHIEEYKCKLDEAFQELEEEMEYLRATGRE